MESEVKAQNAVDSEKLLKKYQRYFRMSAKRGKFRTRNCSKFYCEICKIHYTTRIKAMVAHALAHERDDFIKVGKVPGKNLWRPEQHLYNNSIGKMYHGPDARLERIIIPQSYRSISDDQITCRKCKKFSQSICNVSIHACANRVAKIREHEKGCSAKRAKWFIITFNISYNT